MPAVNEHHVVEGRRLGRRPPSNAPALMLRDVLTGVVPDHPATVDNLSRLPDPCLCGNDTYGDCGPVSVRNYIDMVSAIVGHEVPITLDDVFALYQTQNPQWRPNVQDDPHDDGVVLQDLLDALRKVGIAGWKSLAHAKVDVSNVDEVRAAISIFGGVIFGVDLKLAQQDQTNHGGPWDYVSGSGEWGGHAIAGGSYTSDAAAHHPDIAVITWGQVIAMTDSFVARQVEEAWVVIGPEHLQHPAFQAGIDPARFDAAFSALTGSKPSWTWPNSPTPPSPSPTPVPGGDAPFPGADPSVVPHILAKAHEQGVSVSDWLNHHFRSVFHVH